MSNKYFITLLADDGFPGHAFVNFGKEDDDLMMSISDGTFGMYPKESINGVISLLIGEVPGEIRDDYLRNKDYRLIIEVEAEDYNNCWEILEKWRSKNYQLLKSDCLSFVVEIAEKLSTYINVIDRDGFDNLPAEYLKKTIKEND